MCYIKASIIFQLLCERRIFKPTFHYAIVSLSSKRKLLQLLLLLKLLLLAFLDKLQIGAIMKYPAK